MRFPNQHTGLELAKIVNGEFLGDESVFALGINEIHRLESGDVAFVDHPKYYDKTLSSLASIILIDKEVEVPKGKGIIVCRDPFTSFNLLLEYFQAYEFTVEQQSSDLIVGKNSSIHPSVSIGKNVQIGNNCRIYPNASIGDNVSIGNDVIIQSGAVLGSLGFYYKNRASHFDRLQSMGSVIIEDEVEIGANCTIDKGVTSPTKIGKGTKIDNLVQIGHDTTIGEQCLIAAQVGIAGCVSIGNKVTLWGQVGMVSGISIEDGVVVQGQSGISKSLPGNTTYFGSPAVTRLEKLKELAALRRINNFFDQKTSND